MKYFVLFCLVSFLQAETNSTKKSFFTVEELSRLIDTKEKVDKKYKEKQLFKKRNL